MKHFRIHATFSLEHQNLPIPVPSGWTWRGEVIFDMQHEDFPTLKECEAEAVQRGAGKNDLNIAAVSEIPKGFRTNTPPTPEEPPVEM